MSWTPDPAIICNQQQVQVTIKCSVVKDDVKEVPTLRMLDEDGNVLTEELINIKTSDIYYIQKTITISADMNTTCYARSQMHKLPTISITHLIGLYQGMFINTKKDLSNIYSPNRYGRDRLVNV